MSAAALTIGRLRLDCRVPGAGDATAAARIREAVDALLADDSAPWLDRLLADGDDVVFLERLVIPVELSAAWDRDRIGTAFARALVRALGAALEERAPGPGRVCFRDRGDLVARFLSDVATGAPWPPHWQHEFAGLALLPSSAVIRTVLLDGDDGLEALGRLTASGAARVIAALSPADAVRVVAALAAKRDGDVSQALPAAWRVMQGQTLHDLSGDAHGILRVVCAARADAGAPPGVLVAAVRTLIALSAALGRIGGDMHTVVAQVEARGAPALFDVTGAPVRDLAPLATAPPGWLADVVSAIAASPRAAPARRFTRWGGAFLLLATLARMNPAALDALPALGETAARNLVALVVIARTLGPGAARPVFDDPVLRDVWGIAPRLTLDELSAWAHSAGATGARVIDSAFAGAPPAPAADARGASRTPGARDFAGLDVGHRAVDRALREAAHRLLRRFAWSLPGFAESGPAHVRANFLDLGASVERQGERLVVRLGRPPLDLILRMAGVKRRDVSWMHTHIALFDAE